jgi:hypothetical protein
MKQRKFKAASEVAHVPLMTADEIEDMRTTAVAAGEHYVVALCEVAADKLAPLSAAECMRRLRALAEGRKTQEPYPED